MPSSELESHETAFSPCPEITEERMNNVNPEKLRRIKCARLFQATPWQMVSRRSDDKPEYLDRFATTGFPSQLDCCGTFVSPFRTAIPWSRWESGVAVLCEKYPVPWGHHQSRSGKLPCQPERKLRFIQHNEEECIRTNFFSPGQRLLILTAGGRRHTNLLLLKYWLIFLQGQVLQDSSKIIVIIPRISLLLRRRCAWTLGARRFGRWWRRWRQRGVGGATFCPVLPRRCRWTAAGGTGWRNWLLSNSILQSPAHHRSSASN